MAVAEPEFGNDGLAAGAHRVVLTRPITNLAYPAICPNCGDAADRPLPIAKPFLFSSGGDSGWSKCVAEARPLFCDRCHASHVSQAIPVTDADRVKSLLTQSLVIPALGLGAFGLLIVLDRLGEFLMSPGKEFPIIAFACAMMAIGWYCARMAWHAGGSSRVPMLTPVSSAFDFGDNDDSAYQSTARTYAIRNEACASKFEELNVRRDER